MSPPTWIQDCLPALLEARLRAKWRPTTVQPASFSSRCMGIVAAADDWAQCPDDRKFAHLVCRLLLVVHDLRVGGIYALAHREIIPFDEFYDATRPVDVWMVEPVIDAWREWRVHKSDHAKVCYLMEHALSRALSYAQERFPRLLFAVEREIERMKSTPALDGGCHPDT